MMDVRHLSAIREILGGVFAIGRALDTLGKDPGDENARKAAARLLLWCTDLDRPSGLGRDVDRRIRRSVATAKLLLDLVTAESVDLVTVRAAVRRLQELHARLEYELMTACEDIVLQRPAPEADRKTPGR